MAIRIRQSNNFTIALCAAETDPEPDDIYLDDGIHYALAAKFALDWQNQIVDWQYPEQWVEMNKYKKRDAKKEMEKWVEENENKIQP